MVGTVARVYRFLGLELHEGSGELRSGDRKLMLSRQQLGLLRALARARGRTVSREVLLREVWNGMVVSEGALRQAISELRKLIDPEGERAIEVVRGRGYRLSCVVSVDVQPAWTNRRSASSALIGRDQEVEELDRLRYEALERAGRACVLIGPAGVGKSRLARELAERAALDGTACSESYADRDGALPPLWPFMRLLESCLHDARDDVRARCKAMSPSVFAWLEPSASSERASPLQEPAERRLRFFDQLSRALSLLLREEPRLCVLEDLQWADEGSLAFLAYHARSLGQARALWIFTCRDNDEPQSAALAAVLHALEQGPHNRRITLAALRRGDVAALLCAQLGQDAPEPVVGQVHAMTRGNPLFVLELSRALREGAILRDGSTPRLDAVAVQPVIERRLARLARPALSALQAAAVLGRSVTVVELASLLERPEAEIAPYVEAHVRSGFLVEAGDHRFSFAHPLLQQTTYSLTSYVERCQLHGRIARWLEALPEVERPLRLSELAHHFYQAGHGEHLRKALHFARKAGQAAIAATAYSTAADHFQRAVRCAELLADCDPRERVALELSRLEAVHAQRGLCESLRAEYLALADRACAAGLWELYARATLGYAGHQHARFVPARFAASADPRELAMLEKALQELPDKAHELRVLALCSLAYGLRATGEVRRRRRILGEALERARTIADPALTARVLQVQLFAAAGANFASAMMPTCDEWVELTLRHGLVEQELEARIARYIWHMCRTDRNAALRDAERATRLAEIIGTPRAKSRAELPALLSAFGEGRLDEVERLAEAARSAAPDDPNQQVIHMLRMATIAGLRGKTDLTHAATLYELMLAANPHAVNLRAMLSSVYAALGRRADARRELDVVTSDDFAALPDDINWLPTVALLAEAAVCLGDVERARLIYTKLLPYADVFFFFGVETTPGAAVALWLSDLAIVFGDFEQAEAFLDRAETMHAALGFTLMDQYAAMVRARLLLAMQAPEAPRLIRRLTKGLREFAVERGLGLLTLRADEIENRASPPPAEPVELMPRLSPRSSAHDEN